MDATFDHAQADFSEADGTTKAANEEEGASNPAPRAWALLYSVHGPGRECNGANNRAPLYPSGRQGGELDVGPATIARACRLRRLPLPVSSSVMTRLALVLLLDAFRHDYVGRTSFIRDLASRSRHGAMREHFGFLPRAAYFGGLDPGEAGFTNMFCCDAEASPFGLARGLSIGYASRASRERIGARQWIESEARRRVTPFAASYLTSGAIPLTLLPWFNVAETRAPWDRHVGYRSIFHELDDRDEAFFTCAWPDTNRLTDHSDRGIVDHALTHIEPGHRLAYLHLQELDGLGHAHGPESAQIMNGLAATDALVERLITSLESRFDAVDVLLFGDHGMVSVTGTVDVWSAIDAAGLAVGRDVVFFLDSTMARFWFPTGAARETVLRALERLPGRVLEAPDLERLRIDRCDRRNGELLFLAEPGHIILPNFFQRAGELPRGMHGYEPDCPDNMGAFVVHTASTNPAGGLHEDPSDIGVVDATSVHTELRRLLGLGLARATTVAGTAGRRSLSGTFTQHRDPRVHAVLRGHMAQVTEAARTEVPEATAVVLTGSFGRDEGGVIRDRDGRVMPLNDYDVLVLAPDTHPARVNRLHALGRDLAAEFGIDFVHFSVWPNLAPAQHITIGNFDLRYGSRVLWGPPDLLATLPRFAAADIPLFEGLLLLYNRLGGLLSALGQPRATPAYLRNQIMKGRMALGDWHLLRARAYDVSYATRRERFSWLAGGLPLDAESRQAVTDGYTFKLEPDLVHIDDLDAAAHQAMRWLTSTIVSATGQISRRPVVSTADAADRFGTLLGQDDGARCADNKAAADALAARDGAHVLAQPKGSVRHAIYAAFPLLASALDGDAAALAHAAGRLEGCLTAPWPRELTADHWNQVRRRATDAWLALVG
jgi:hypothetical protein